MTRPALLLAALAASAPAMAWTPNNNYDAVWPGALPWRLHNGGSASIPTLATVESVLQSSMDTWSDPTCSAFSHSYNGRTGTSSSANGDNTTVMGFLASWPSSYGDRYSTIGITSSRFSGLGNAWDIVEADVSFNEHIWTFIQGSPTQQYVADLQSIATHEFGHALGLGHSNFQSATMFASYVGGTGARSLDADDESGVCSLYPGGGGGPTNPSDDTCEDNDNSGDAAGVSCGDQVTGEGNDDDWYFIQTASSGTVAADLAWSASADLDLYLFSAQAELDRSEQSNTQAEAVSASNQPSGSYYLLVRNYQGSGAYTLDITCDGTAGGSNGGVCGSGGSGGGNPPGGDDAYEENDSVSEGAPVSCPGVISGTAADDDWFVFQTLTEGSISLSLTWTGAADLDLYLVDASSEVGRSVEETGNAEVIALRTMPAGMYGVVVDPYAGTAEYELELSCGSRTDPGDPGSGEDDTGDDGGADEGDDDTPGIGDDPFSDDAVTSACAGCASWGAPGMAWVLVPGVLVGLRRRR